MLIILWILCPFNLRSQAFSLFSLLESSPVLANKCPCDSNKCLEKQILQVAVFSVSGIQVLVEIHSVEMQAHL